MRQYTAIPYFCKMDLYRELLKKHHKDTAVKIADYIGKDTDRFQELMDLMLHGEKLIAQRAAWVISHCADKHPTLITPHLKNLIFNLKKTDQHDAIPRNTLRVLTEQRIPEPLQGILLEVCFEYLQSQKIPVAIKAHAMQCIFNVSKNEPDLLRELKMVIEEQIPYGTAGFKSRGKKILMEISRLIR